MRIVRYLAKRHFNVIDAFNFGFAQAVMAHHGWLVSFVVFAIGFFISVVFEIIAKESA